MNPNSQRAQWQRSVARAAAAARRTGQAAVAADLDTLARLERRDTAAGGCFAVGAAWYRAIYAHVMEAADARALNADARAADARALERAQAPMSAREYSSYAAVAGGWDDEDDMSRRASAAYMRGEAPLRAWRARGVRPSQITRTCQHHVRIAGAMRYVWFYALKSANN